MNKTGNRHKKYRSCHAKKKAGYPRKTGHETVLAGNETYLYASDVRYNLTYLCASAPVHTRLKPCSGCVRCVVSVQHLCICSTERRHFRHQQFKNVHSENHEKNK